MKHLLFFLLLIPAAAFAQQTGKVEYKHLGVSFIIPDQWIGREVEGGYLLGHNTIPGMILMLPHDRKYSLEDLKTMAQQGLNEGNGTFLTLNGQLEALGNDAVGGNFTGTLNHEQVNAYLIGLTNSFGYGLTIIALTSPQQFNSSYKEYALAVRNNISFYKPETGPIVDEWKNFLSNYKLTYMDSYYSSGDMGGGYSVKREIDLCGEGFFNYRGRSSVSISGDNASASSMGNNRGNGTWEITVDGGGNPVLRLNYYSGEYADYPLRYENSKLFLNGERYYRTRDNTGPYCN